MDFESDELIEQISRNEKKDTFGLIICALFHKPKPIEFANFYHQLIDQLRMNFSDDEKQSIYLYPIEHLHITISTLYSFKFPWPQSPDKCLQHWKECFRKLKQSSHQGRIVLSIDSIQLSKAAGYFLFKDETNGVTQFRESIRTICVPEADQPALQTPNIVHTSFLRFIRKPVDGKSLEEKFHRICSEIFSKTNSICLTIDEVCLAFERHPYMHIDCDDAHVLDIIQF